MKHITFNYFISMPTVYKSFKAYVIGNYYRSVDGKSIREWRKLPSTWMSGVEVISLPLNEQTSFIELEDVYNYHISEQYSQYN